MKNFSNFIYLIIRKIKIKSWLQSYSKQIYFLKNRNLEKSFWVLANIEYKGVQTLQ